MWSSDTFEFDESLIKIHSTNSIDCENENSKSTSQATVLIRGLLFTTARPQSLNTEQQVDQSKAKFRSKLKKNRGLRHFRTNFSFLLGANQSSASVDYIVFSAPQVTLSFGWRNRNVSIAIFGGRKTSTSPKTASRFGPRPKIQHSP